MWKETEGNLTKKREVRAKLELQRKMDKIPAVSAEITDASTELNLFTFMQYDITYYISLK